jgi:DNA repair exonuclease SbcCD ATPase subunit
MSKVTELRQTIEQKKGQLHKLQQLVATTNKKLILQQRRLRHHEQAREVIREVGLLTQRQLQSQISELTSLALESVFDNPYQLVVEFVERRNKTECDLYFERDGNNVDPLSSTGGGVVDVAAFALRVASWAMKRDRARNVMLLDEPFSRLKGREANLKALQMVHQISNDLQLQVIMVSDERVEKDLIEQTADRVFDSREFNSGGK